MLTQLIWDTKHILFQREYRKNVKFELPHVIQVPMVTESGLQYKDIKVGQGPSPPVGFQVAAHLVMMFSNMFCCFY
jgi:hypothetical protein